MHYTLIYTAQGNKYTENIATQDDLVANKNIFFLFSVKEHQSLRGKLSTSLAMQPAGID